MRTIVYDVAVSLDGYISGPHHAVDGFVPEGQHVQDYLARLQNYSTVIMGRRTYEFGYQYGLKLGQKPYPHMQNFIFSSTLDCEDGEGLFVVRHDFAEKVRELKASPGGDIYLCGGGRFAGLLLEQGLIDRLLLKVNPILLGEGTPLFETSYRIHRLNKRNETSYDNGVSLITFDVLK